MAVAEFLENVDLGALGLGDSEKKVIRCEFLFSFLLAQRFILLIIFLLPVLQT